MEPRNQKVSGRLFYTTLKRANKNMGIRGMKRPAGEGALNQAVSMTSFLNQLLLDLSSKAPGVSASRTGVHMSSAIALAPRNAPGSRQDLQV